MCVLNMKNLQNYSINPVPLCVYFREDENILMNQTIKILNFTNGQFTQDKGDFQKQKVLDVFANFRP